MMTRSSGSKDNDGGSGGGGQQLSSKKKKKTKVKTKCVAELLLVTGKGSGGKRKKKWDDGGGGKMLNEKAEFKAVELAECKRELMSSGLQASVFLQEYAPRTPLLPGIQQVVTTDASGGNDLVPPPSRWTTKLLQIVSPASEDNDGGGGGQQLSSKKGTKQNRKLASEHGLVTGKGEESGSGGKKKKKKKKKWNDGGGKDGGGGKVLNEKQFQAMELKLAERKRALMSSVFLQEYATPAPLLLSDIQQLVTYAYGGNDLVPRPRKWCHHYHLQNTSKLLQIVVLVVDGVGLNEFVDNKWWSFSKMVGVFGGGEEEGIFEVLDPKWKWGSVFGEVERWGILGGGGSNNNAGDADCNQNQVEVKEEKKVKAEVTRGKKAPTASTEKPPAPAVQNFGPILNQLRSVFPIKTKNKPSKTDKAEHSSTDMFPRTALVLTLSQLIQENYPLPISANKMVRNSHNTKPNYKLLSGSYAPVTPNSKMYSIDCEMVKAVGDPKALIRIGIIDEELGTVYESLVKPTGQVLDYRTEVSGVSEEMMERVETSLGDVQEKLREIVTENPGCILVGQSLNHDFKAMKIIHPYVIDTATIFNLTGIAGKKSSLKDLSLNLLGENIQNPKRINPSNGQPLQGHCPVEDARTAMKLVKAKLANGYSFGNNMKSSGGCGQSAGGHTSTLVASEDPLAKNKLLSSAGNKLTKTKDVLIVTQDDSDNFPFTSTQNTPSASGSTNDSSQPVSVIPNQPTKITVKSATTNGDAIKLMYSHFLESFLTVGFYKLNEDDEESEDFEEALGKLDERVEELFKRMCHNSMLVVVGCGGKGSSNSSGEGSSKKNGGSESERKNNGVAFVRVKVDDLGGG